MTALDIRPGAEGEPTPGVGYTDVLRQPYARRLLVGTIVGRLPSGMAPLAILLAAAERLGYATGTAMAALFLLASAIGGPMVGRAVDRYGQRLAFSVSAAASSAALVTLAVGPAPQWCASAAVLLAGGARPPLESGLRVLLSTEEVMPTAEHQRVALALEAALQEVIYIVGPLLVAGITWATSPAWAVTTTAALGALGTLTVVTTPPSRAWRSDPGRTADWLGPLRSRQLPPLYLAMVWAGIPIGALTPLAVSAAARYDVAALSGALPAALSAGAVLGGLAYGARAWPGSPADHLSVLSAVSAAGWCLAAVMGSPATALAATVVPGLVMAPLLGAALLTTSALAPRGSVTEAQAWLVAALDIGCALGTAGAGVWHELLLPTAAAAAALTLAATRRRLNPLDRHHPLLPPSKENRT